MTRRMGIMGLLAFLVAWGCLPTMARAAAERPWRPLDEGVYAISPSADSALELRASGSGVSVASAGDGPEQAWQVAYDEGGRALLTSLASGKALGASGSEVRVLDGGGDASRWVLDVQDDGTFCLASAEDGRSLEVSGGARPGAALRMASANAGASQRFSFEKTDPLADGVYRMEMGGGAGHVVGVSQGSTSQGAPLVGVKPGSGLDQRWLATREADGAYRFEVLSSGLVLTAAEGSPGAAIVQSERGASTLSGFYLEPAGGGTFSLRLRGSDALVGLASEEDGAESLVLCPPGDEAALEVRFADVPLFESGYWRIAPLTNASMTLDVAGASVAAGANVELWGANDGYNQTFDVKMLGDDVCEFGLCELSRVIAPRGGSAGIFANIEQCERTGALSQRWRIAYEGGRGFSFTNMASGLRLGVAGGSATWGANVELQMPTSNPLQRFTLVRSSYKEPPSYYGFQNPAGYYQVSNESVWFPHVGEGIFGYRTESRIGKAATKDDCLNAMIGRAHEYLGTRYVWDYSCAPGVGVDCAGLVLQALYATGMDMSPMNPWDHFYTPGHDHYAVWMAQSGKFKHVALSERQRGDLIFYSGHVAIYLGNDVILEANVPSVRTANIYSPGAIIGVARPYV